MQEDGTLERDQLSIATISLHNKSPQNFSVTQKRHLFSSYICGLSGAQLIWASPCWGSSVPHLSFLPKTNLGMSFSWRWQKCSQGMRNMEDLLSPKLRTDTPWLWHHLYWPKQVLWLTPLSRNRKAIVPFLKVEQQSHMERDLDIVRSEELRVVIQHPTEGMGNDWEKLTARWSHRAPLSPPQLYLYLLPPYRLILPAGGLGMKCLWPWLVIAAQQHRANWTLQMTIVAWEGMCSSTC